MNFWRSLHRLVVSWKFRKHKKRTLEGADDHMQMDANLPIHMRTHTHTFFLTLIHKDAWTLLLILNRIQWARDTNKQQREMRTWPLPRVTSTLPLIHNLSQRTSLERRILDEWQSRVLIVSRGFPLFSKTYHFLLFLILLFYIAFHPVKLFTSVKFSHFICSSE